MPYSSTAYRLLVSTPGDIPNEDIAACFTAINRWNVLSGRPSGAVVVPVQWELHAAAEHGRPAQSSLNEQLVADADIVIALFWHRLGSPTGDAESGTAEEIQRAQDAGAYVGILRCVRPYPQDVDTAQLNRLREFHETTAERSLILEYADEAQLTRHVDAILNQAVTRDLTRAEAAVETAPARADVWPRIERSEKVETDRRGRIKTRHRWSLVLANRGAEPAQRVAYRLEPEAEDDSLPMEVGDSRELEALAPGGEASYSLAIVMGTAPQVRCVVTWVDSAGEHENRATLRFR